MLWVAVATGGGLTHRTTREPMPAREVERPLVLPAGWTVLRGDAGVDGVGVSGRWSVTQGLELSATGATGLPWSVGGAVQLGRGEAPARSAALGLRWTPPTVEEGHVLWTEAAARSQWGGLRGTIAPGAGVYADGGWTAGIGARGECLLQAGPLGGLFEGDGRWTSGGWLWDWRAEGFVQLNRAVRVGVGASRRRSIAASLELAL